VSELTPRLRDEIDDQVAEAFDAYLADRLAEPGPLCDAVRGRRRAAVALATAALGVVATWLAPGAAWAVWLAVAVVAWAVCRSLS
jgi:hypothetical protein